MNWMISLLPSDSCTNLVLALFHTLWQSAAIAALLYLFLRSPKAKHPNSRYTYALLALAGVVVCTLFTWAILNYEHPNAQPTASSAVTSTTSIAPASQTSNVATAEQSEALQAASTTAMADRVNWHSWIMAAWLIGVLAMLCRMLSMIIGIGQLKKECLPLDDQSISQLVE